MDITNKLIAVLEKSIEKNGNQPLTTQYLLNLIKYCDKSVMIDESILQRHLDSALSEIYTDQCG